MENNYNNINSVYALMDCNQFYVSCERAFNPFLENKPVGVLSNNDGCLVALSPELKAMGITRGMPGFKVKEMLQKQGKYVYLFSSNYELYGDMSSRVMKIARDTAIDIEIYSIDEAFLLLDGIQPFNSYTQYAETLRTKIKKSTGIPVSIGIAKTKTLAKIANKIAKKTKSGVFDLTTLSEDEIHKLLKSVKVEDIWGIGRQHNKRLRKNGIYTAYDFINCNQEWVKKEMSIVGEKTQLELKGIPCSELEKEIPNPKSIVCSRSFGRPVAQYIELAESISLFCTKAIKRLRKKNHVAKTLHIFITTNPFNSGSQYANFTQANLINYSAYTPDFIKLAISLLEKIYKPGYAYKKSGVMITNMIPEDRIYPDLFYSRYGDDNRDKVMKLVDKINKQYNKDIIFFASNGIKKSWSMKREMISSRFTTRWTELPIVKAK
ncbi:MAG: Y-family DNA polymerase [Candidatus Cloacimonetes bacterium]|nr:Y-family DNA polymerase [Candidatus Cloacimonadota bacterium]